MIEAIATISDFTIVTPAKAGVHEKMDSRLRGNDGSMLTEFGLGCDLGTATK
jgi:hypothetical protein